MEWNGRRPGEDSPRDIRILNWPFLPRKQSGIRPSEVTWIGEHLGQHKKIWPHHQVDSKHRRRGEQGFVFFAGNLVVVIRPISACFMPLLMNLLMILLLPGQMHPNKIRDSQKLLCVLFLVRGAARGNRRVIQSGEFFVQLCCRTHSKTALYRKSGLYFELRPSQLGAGRRHLLES